MAKNDQNEFPLLVGLDNQKTRQTARHLPTFFRTDQNKKFLGGTFDPLVQPGKLSRINAYIGRKDIPNYLFDDNYVEENSTPRQYYQLEPSYSYQDPVTKEVDWYADYLDYINGINYFGAPVANHSRLNKQEAYTWNPNIDWDKFVNYREYYWIPNGPDPIKITGEMESISSTYTVKIQQQGDNSTYIFSPSIFPPGLTSNPRLTLYRGVKYTFVIDGPGKSFCIKTQIVGGDAYTYNIGVSQQKISSGTLTFEVPFEAPNLLYYIDSNDINTVGMIDIKDLSSSLYLDVEAEILGKKNYITSSGIDLINGLKLKFSGNIKPEKYANGFWYVEGVGTKIKLINYEELETPAIYGSTIELPFDNEPFDSLPWDTASNYPLEKDYITISRASTDRNTWSRNNRWFSRSVLETTATANGQVAIIDQSQRALRPIIEFFPNIKLYQHGWIYKSDVDFIDTFTTDVFSTIEGKIGYKIDGDNSILPGYRILFTADSDPLVKGKIFEVKQITNNNLNQKQLTLQPTADSDPIEGEIVYVTKGDKNSGCSYYYQNGIWNLAQKKSAVNQEPLFDLFDEDKISFSDTTIYTHTTFPGNRIFGYKKGTGTSDTELGFPISHLNINNVGDIQFEFDLETKTWSYQSPDAVTLIDSVININSYTGFLRRYNDDATFTYLNGWVRTARDTEQNVVRVLRVGGSTDLISIDVFDNSASLTDLRIKVYVNDTKVEPANLSLETIGNTAYIRFSYMLMADDKVVYKVRSSASKNLKGYYEIPSNWQNNPFNDSVSTFTFGEATDHLKSIIEDVPGFSGAFPGNSNLPNIGLLSPYGKRFLQHSGSMPLASFLLRDEHANVVRALRWTATRYSEFKKEFLRLAQTNAYEGSITEIVDQILLDYSKAKYIDTSPFHFSDMAPYGAASIRNYVVNDPRLPMFVIDSIFDPMTITKRSVLVYLNDVQLVYNRDYNFDIADAFVNIKVSLSVGDTIIIKDYASTDGCYIPFTPSALGIYPSFIPEKYIDDTYVTTIPVIQGHDGSIIAAYNDYRDDLILDLETRIFNTRRVEYDISMFNIHSVIGTYYFRTDYTKTEIDDIMLTDFLSWNSIIDQDFTSNNSYIEEQSFTYNYGRATAPNTTEQLTGYWRSVYRYFYDTDRPHTHPWEMQGFSIKPDWWDSAYGLPPYTSDNKILWDSIENGIIRDPSGRRTIVRYKRIGLRNYLPVDSAGNLLSPLDSNLVTNFSLVNGKGTYVFGDQAPAENAWRRSSEYPFSVSVVMCLLRGSEFIGKMWDRFRIKRNLANQVYYTPTGKRLRTADLVFSDAAIDNSNDPNALRTYTSGLANIVEEYVFIQKYINIDTYKTYLSGLTAKLSYKIGGYTSKEKIKVLLDSRSPTSSSGNIFLPDENYQIFYNKSFPVSTISYSGVLIERLGSTYPDWLLSKRYRKGDRVIYQKDIYRCTTAHSSDKIIINYEELTIDYDPQLPGDLSTQRFNKNINYWAKENTNVAGYKIKGYDNSKNYFEIYPPRISNADPTFNVGGISETYVIWTGNTSNSIPIVSGDPTINAASSIHYAKGQVAKVGDIYYRALVGHTASTTFANDIAKWQVLGGLPIVGGRTASRRTNFEDTVLRIPYGIIFTEYQTVVDFLLGYQKRLETLGFVFDDYDTTLGLPLDWLTSSKEFIFWTLQNWSAGAVITLSPSANMLKFVSTMSASIDGFVSDFHDYSIFKADGSQLKADLTDVYREDNGFTIKPSVETNDGIFHIRTNLVYREHVLLLDNVSIFNDILYDVVPGYRQGRVKLLGFKTSDWDGGFTSPGFVYDEAKVSEWKPDTDYGIGDVVRYKNYYFTAASRINANSSFAYEDWTKLAKKPKAGLIPNFDYKIEQFRDFYSLDASIYDSNQQALARHLIGYQPRSYLNNIIVDDVSQYKFYQGFIKEKGTYNSVSKLFDALRASGFSTVDIKEEWAFKLGDYGAVDGISEIEFPLDEHAFRYNPQDIILTSNPQEFDDLSIYNVTSRMLTIKPSSYDSNPFKLVKLDSEQSNFGVFKYRVAGYVRDEDVDHILFNEAALMNYDINYFRENDKIWLGYTSNNDWDVLNYINLKITITNWSVQGNIVSLECSRIPDVAKNDIITISNLDTIDGTYKVQKVYNNIIEVFTFNSTLFHLQDDSTHGLLYKMQSVRFKDLSGVAIKNYNKPNIKGEKIWVDSDSNKRWMVLENEDVFTKYSLPTTVTNKVDYERYGSTIKISGDQKWMFVAATNLVNKNSSGEVLVSGLVFIYSRHSILEDWSLFQSISMPTGYLTVLTGSEKFGTSIDASDDGKLVVVGVPFASNLRTYFKGDYSSITSYNAGDIVKYNSKLWKCLQTTMGRITNSAYWQQTILQGVNYSTAPSSSLNNQGVVTVFRYNPSTSAFEIETVISSSDPTANENFGSKVRIKSDGINSWLVVGGKGYNSGAGRVQIFKNNRQIIKATNTNFEGNFITVDSTANLYVGMPVVFTDNQFGSLSLYTTYYIYSIDSIKNIITITASVGGSQYVLTNGSGVATMTAGGWTYSTQTFLDLTLPAGSQFGYDLDMSDDLKTIVASAPAYNEGAAYVFQYQKSSDSWIQSEVINATTIVSKSNSSYNLVGTNSYLSAADQFGYAVLLTNDTLLISCPNDDVGNTDLGSVYHFDILDGFYRLKNIILPPTTLTTYKGAQTERFGLRLSLNTTAKVLAVSSAGGNFIGLTFDVHVDRLVFTDAELRNYELDPVSKLTTYPTTFDADSTAFYDLTSFTGAVYVYNDFENNFIYGDKLVPDDTLVEDDEFGAAIAVAENYIAVGTPNHSVNGHPYGNVYMFDFTSPSWKTIASQDSVVDVDKFKKAFIYNTATNTLVQDLEFYDPAKGMISKVAEQEINYQTYHDPAVYQYGLHDSGMIIDQSNPWTDEHVGKTWWDLSRFKYTWYEQGDATYRTNNWGRLFTGSTINVYEWVETTYLPSRWAILADTTDGLAQGISGIPREIDDFTYSTKFKYDPISGTNTTMYYYWVKDKTTLPNVPNRNLSCADLARLIFDPKSQGKSYISITGQNSMSLTNVNNKLIHSDISLNMEFHAIDNKDLAIHRQYALIAANDAKSIIPHVLEQKWFDSLIGYNSLGYRVPDPNVSQKQKYGTLNSPRQSWFVNRYEALKQLFEYVNTVLAANQIIDDFSLTNLKLADTVPNLTSGLIDQQIDILDELRFIGVTRLQTALLSVRVENGSIVNVNIDDRGFGYGTNKVYNANWWYGPTVSISGTGEDAIIQTYVDKFGRVAGTDIVRKGTNYDQSTTLISVRPFTVLVLNDAEASNGWSLQQWDTSKLKWFRIKTQAYDVTRYWSYKDWYTSGYSINSDINYQVDGTYELGALSADIGQIVKVRDAGYGNWLLLERIAETNGPDYTIDYKVIGKQNATIAFSTALYNLNRDIGYDTNFGYSSNLYDQNPTTELRIILQALRDDILVDNLRIEYVNIFFNSVYYVLSEQLYADWVFKTSFLKVNHNVGTLRQRITFQSDVLESYQHFLEEAKPYKTKIREWVSSYERLQQSGNVITDFDLPSHYDNAIGAIETVNTNSTNITVYPWKNWLDNHTYQVINIAIADVGKNYYTAPKVIISGGFADTNSNQTTVISSIDMTASATYVQLARTSGVTTSSPMSINIPGVYSIWTFSQGNLILSAAGLPYHGFGNPAAVNIARAQDYKLTLPLRAGTDDPSTSAYTVNPGAAGFWLNGVAVFNPSAANGAPKGFDLPPAGFNYNAAFEAGQELGYSFGEDLAGGHAQENGVYHYHDFSFAEAWRYGKGAATGSNTALGVSEVSVIPYLNGTLTHPNGHSKILGWAIDGYPIYGPYGYTNAISSTSKIKRMKTGYRLKDTSYRLGTGASNLYTYPMGIFVQDYEFAEIGDLDTHNGRYCVTPDYPNGTYAYFVTIDVETDENGLYVSEAPVYPYVIGTTFYATPLQQGVNIVPGKGIAPVAFSVMSTDNVAATQKEINATATAYIADGKLYKIVIDDPGIGYITAPMVHISGGTADVANDGAKAYAIIGNGKTKSTTVGIKFDRYTFSYEASDFRQTDLFTGDNKTNIFKLSYAPEIEKNKINISIDGIEIFGAQYTVSLNKVLHDTYTALEGTITFTDIPADNSNIQITYDKNISLYSAADRINYAYNKTTGQLGKNLGQLMTGIDYGGVSLTSIDFDVSGGWDVLPWDAASWDNVLDTNNDVVIISDGTTRSFDLGYIPEDGEVINVYIERKETTITKITRALTVGMLVIPVESLEGIKVGDSITIPSITYSGIVMAVNIDISTKTVVISNLIPHVVSLNSDIRFTRTTTVRIDDPYYSVYDDITEQPNGRKTAPDNAQMDSFVGDGSTSVITIPHTVDLYGDMTPNTTYDTLIFRKSTSDGSLLPTDRSLMDSFVIGGDLAYQTAKGIAADEITIDGDGFVTTDTSHGPEELIQGQVIDTLDLNVYHAPSAGGPNVVVQHFEGDGSTKTYTLDQIPGTADGLTVVVNGMFVESTINFIGRTVTLNQTPADGSKVSIMSIDTAGYDILDKAEFVGDGSTKEFLMAARFANGDVTVFATVDGIVNPVNIKASNNTYKIVNDVIVLFDIAPAINSVIQIMVFSAKPYVVEQKFSEVTSQYITVVSDVKTYTLNNPPKINGPISSSVFVVAFSYLKSSIYKIARDSNVATVTTTSSHGLTVGTVVNITGIDYYSDSTLDGFNATEAVIQSVPSLTTFTYNNVGDDKSESTVDGIVVTNEQFGEFLRAPECQNFVYDGVHKSIAISEIKYSFGSLIRADINVYNNGALLIAGRDYQLDTSTNLITLTGGNKDDEIIVEIVKNNDFIIQDNTIVFSPSYKIDSINQIKVTTFTNHNILKVKRSSKIFRFTTGYDLLTYDTTRYSTFTSAINTSGVLDLPRSISSNSGLFVAFNRKLLTLDIDYTVLDNRNQIKVILPDILGSNDYIDIITMNDVTVRPSYGFKIFKDMINRPHYKVLDKRKTTILAKPLRYFDTKIEVEDGSVLENPGGLYTSGARSNVPGVIEIAGERIEYFIKEGNILRQLRRCTLGTGMNNMVNAGTKVVELGQKNTIPYSDIDVKKNHFGDGVANADGVVIGTQIFDLDFVPTARYLKTDTDKTPIPFIHVGDIPSGYYPCDQIEVFVAGRRLCKDPIKVYDPSQGQDSYNDENYVWLDAEFSVNGTSKSVRLTKAPSAGQLIVIIYKQGKIWQKYNEGVSLRFSDTDIARFVTARSVDLPK